MKTPNFRKLSKMGKAFLTKHSADILTGFTAAGVVITALETRKATLRAEEYLRVNGYDQANPDTQKVLKLEAAKMYLVPAATGVATIGAAVGANYINHKQIAGLAAACTVAETALTEHRDKLEELLGEKTLKKIDDEVALDRAVDILENDDEILDTGRGKVIICEGYFTGKKILASPEFVQRVVNEYNERVNQDTYASCAEYLELFFMDVLRDIVIPDIANTLGYSIHQNGLMRVELTSDIDPKTGYPYLVVMPTNPPIHNFMEIF